MIKFENMLPFKEDFDIMSCLMESEGDSKNGWRRLVFDIPNNMLPNTEAFDLTKYEISVEQEVNRPYRVLTIEKRYHFKDHLDGIYDNLEPIKESPLPEQPENK